MILAGPELASSIRNAPKFSSGVIYGIGAQFNVWETPHSSQLSLFTEINGVARAPFDALSQPAEWIVGFKGLFLDQWSPFFGATFGLNQGYGAATFRLFLGFSWTYSAKEKLPHQAPLSPIVIVQTIESPLVKVLGSKINIPIKTFSDFEQDHPQVGDLRVLDSIALLLQARPDLKKVRIEGHTDNLGSDKYNLELSWRRAVFVKTYLVSKGIDDSRLVIEGFGFRCPLVPNDTAEHQAQNRRVEFVIVEQEGQPLNTAKCTTSVK